MNRLNQLPTLRIDASAPLSFSYRGKPYRGVQGDSVASALFAGGVRIFGRSLKYHRPRGLYSLDGECSNTMMAIDGMPNVRAETTLLKGGMSVQPQNVKGSPELDLMAGMDKMSWAMPAGFYYKTMHKPAKIWPHAIKMIRKAAGLGVMSPDFRMPGSFDEIYPTADVCVIGGGPAGMSAALAAAKLGLRVIVLEARPWLGGFFDYRTAANADGQPLHARGRELAKALAACDNVRIFTRTHMIGAYNNNLITAFQVGAEADVFDERYIEIRANSVVVATGCIERPLLFENNERPGVMQMGCAHRLAHTYGILPGENAVFSIAHDLGLEAALDLHRLGVRIAAVADAREDGQDPQLLAALIERDIPFMRGWVAHTAHGKVLRKATLTTVNGRNQRDIACDLLVASAGLTPVTGPLTIAQGQVAYDNFTGAFLPSSLPTKMHAAGRIVGLYDPAALEASGTAAGLAAAKDCGVDAGADWTAAQDALSALPGAQRGSKLVMAPVNGHKSFVCFDEDTTVKNVDQAIADGFDMPELIKRFTSAGTGPGQGGIPGHNLPLLVAQAEADASVLARPTNSRAPLAPISMAAASGSNHDMSKRTAVHRSQIAAGGQMERVGVWNRVRYFSADKRSQAEIENVRTNVGLLDASTLGKFRLTGPDALKALQRVYVSDMAKTVPGKCKYSAMCNDDGCIVDDGVVIKRAENDYYLTTSTGRAGQTVEWFRYHTRYDGWDFNLVNLTDAFGVINMAGPNARKVLAKITDADVSNEAFPYLGYRELVVHKRIPVKAMRLGFVGELSYEFHVAASYMQALWDIIEEAGAEFKIANFGLEAQSTLRMEKCHVIIGSESEQRTTLHDIGLGWLWDRNKPEAKTVGAIALRQTEKQKDRLKLVAFQMEDDNRPAKDGSPIVDNEIRGYVCISRYSKTLGKSIGMALVEDHLAQRGMRLEVYEDGCKGKLLYARVTPMPFYDPQGKRQRM